MEICVLKFGGSSVATVEKVEKIAAYLKKRLSKDQKLCVVVSAMGDTTDQLLQQAHQIHSFPNERELAQLITIGEQQSCVYLTLALQKLNVRAKSLTGSQAGILTTDFHLKSKIKQVDSERIKNEFTESEILVVAGFQGYNAQGEVTTLGRGGSDTTAVGIAAAMGCDCEIYTDVAGVFTTDPRVYPEAKKLNTVTYDEMIEMSALGAGVLETRSVEIAKKYQIKIYLGKSLSDERGTYIMGEQEMMEHAEIVGVSHNDHIAEVTIKIKDCTYMQAAHIFEILTSKNLSVFMPAYHESQEIIEFQCLEEDLTALHHAQQEIEAQYGVTDFSVEMQHARVSLIGRGLKGSDGLLPQVFQVLRERSIPFRQLVSSENSLSFTTEKELAVETVQVLCHSFGL